MPQLGAAAWHAGAPQPQPLLQPQPRSQHLLLQPPNRQPPWHFFWQQNSPSSRPRLQHLLLQPQPLLQPLLQPQPRSQPRSQPQAAS